MSKAEFIKKLLPGTYSVAGGVVSALLLGVAFPNFEFYYLAWIALVPFFLAIYTERESIVRCFLLGAISGSVFYYFTCYWLTFAPITYAGFPPALAYFLMVFAAVGAGVFIGVFAAALSFLSRRFGMLGFLAAPLVWVFAEFLRMHLTGNNWNSLGYSLAFTPLVRFGRIGGVDLLSFYLALSNILLASAIIAFRNPKEESNSNFRWSASCAFLIIMIIGVLGLSGKQFKDLEAYYESSKEKEHVANLVAVQPNVPMAGLNQIAWKRLRREQVEQAQSELSKVDRDGLPRIVVLPESPMNFQYELDQDFRGFINNFATDNQVSVLFNSAEPDRRRERGFFNSAVMVSKEGKKVDQYDKIHLLPFGEFVPLPEFAQEIIPPMVGRFSFGEEYDLLPFGDAQGGIMICFESHFPSLSREFTLRGADILVEMTNDGYLGPTAVLRQHLASAAFRAAETGRPVLRVTNVGVTAYVTEQGQILDAPKDYVKAERHWRVYRSNGVLTIFMQVGYYFPLLCFFMTVALLLFGLLRKPNL